MIRTQFITVIYVEIRNLLSFTTFHSSLKYHRRQGFLWTFFTSTCNIFTFSFLVFAAGPDISYALCQLYRTHPLEPFMAGEPKKGGHTPSSLSNHSILYTIIPIASAPENRLSSMNVPQAFLPQLPESYPPVPAQTGIWQLHIRLLQKLLW